MYPDSREAAGIHLWSDVSDVSDFLNFRGAAECFDCMDEIMIYGGIGSNVIGAIYLMAYAMKYAYAFRLARKRNVRSDGLKAAWGKKRMIGFGLMIVGLIIAIVGCYL